MIPTKGRIVHYTLRADQAAAINAQRKAARDHSKSLHCPMDGTMAHTGNSCREGDVFPMMIVQTWGNQPNSAVNGQVYLDGNDIFWATSVSVGEGPGTWAWPQREPSALELGAAVRASGEQPLVDVKGKDDQPKASGKK